MNHRRIDRGTLAVLILFALIAGLLVASGGCQSPYAGMSGDQRAQTAEALNAVAGDLDALYVPILRGEIPATPDDVQGLADTADLLRRTADLVATDATDAEAP